MSLPTTPRSMVSPPLPGSRSTSFRTRSSRFTRSIRRNYFYYLLALPGLLYFLVFEYGPIVLGGMIAFKDISPFDGFEGVLSEPYVGLANFQRFFDSYYFWNVLSNTLIISAMKLAFGFPAPIILALMINEVRSTVFKRTVQTISYMPHFLSMVIVAGLVMSLLTTEGGLVNHAVVYVGGEPHAYLTDPAYFRWILVGTTIWQTVGWGTILYLAAMANIDPQLYEAAVIDGANRWQQMRTITLPSISFVIILLLIFQIGNLLNAGFEQILLLYSPSVYSVSDIIDTYVYRSGLLEMEYSFATAVGLFKAVLALVLILIANAVARRFGHTGIW